MLNKEYSRIGENWVQFMEPRDVDKFILNGTGTTVRVVITPNVNDPSLLRSFPLGGTIGQMRIPADHYAYAKADIFEVEDDDIPVIPESVLVVSDEYIPPSGEVKNELTAISEQLMFLADRMTTAEIKIEKQWLRYSWFVKEVLKAQRDLQEQIAGFVKNLFYLQRQLLKISMYYEKQKLENQKIKYLIQKNDKTEDIKKITNDINLIVNHLQVLNNNFGSMKSTTDLALKYMQDNHSNVAAIFTDILNHNRRIFLLEKETYHQRGVNADADRRILLATEKHAIDYLNTRLSIILSKMSDISAGYVDVKNDAEEATYVAESAVVKVMEQDKRLFAAEMFIIDQKGENLTLEGLIGKVSDDLDAKTIEIQEQLTPIVESVNTINGELEAIEPRIEALEEASPEDVTELKENLQNLQGDFSNLNNALNQLASAHTEEEINQAFAELLENADDEETKSTITSIKDLLVELKTATEVNIEQAEDLDEKVGTNDRISIIAPSITDIADELQAE